MPRWDDLHLYFTPSPVTSDFIVDVLERWWRRKQERFPRVDTLVINQDNGPEILSYSMSTASDNDNIVSVFMTYAGGNAAKTKTDALGKLIAKRSEELLQE